MKPDLNCGLSYDRKTIMRSNTFDDPWLLPTDQADYPSRATLSDSLLHGRREATFLALAALLVVSTSVLVVAGTSRIFDLAAALSYVIPDLEPAFAMELPLGAIALPLGFAALALVCELYGRRRATALVMAGSLAAIAGVGVAWLSDAAAGVDAALGPALAFAAAFVVANAIYVLVFDAMRARARGRRSWLRVVIAAPVYAAGIGLTFGVVLYAYAPSLVGSINAMAAGTIAFVFSGCVVMVVPIAIARRAFAVYLRRPLRTRSRSRSLPPAVIVETPVSMPTPAAAGSTRIGGVSQRRSAARKTIEPFNSAEMEFFAEGDALEN